MGGRDGIPSSEDRRFKMNKLTDVLKGKTSESEEFALAYHLKVTRLAEDTSSPYFHLFGQNSSFPHRSAAGKTDGCKVVGVGVLLYLQCRVMQNKAAGCRAKSACGNA